MWSRLDQPERTITAHTHIHTRAHSLSLSLSLSCSLAPGSVRTCTLYTEYRQQWGRDKGQVQCWCWTRLISTIFGLCMCIARYSTMIPAYVIIAMGREGWCTLARQWLSRRALFFPSRAGGRGSWSGRRRERARFVLPRSVTRRPRRAFQSQRNSNAAWHRDSLRLPPPAGGIGLNTQRRPDNNNCKR